MNDIYYGGVPPYGIPPAPIQQPMYQQQVHQQMTPFVPVPQHVAEANHKPPHIRAFIREFNDNARQKFNDKWFQRDDDAIIDGVEKVILSCQRDKYFTLQVTGFRVVKDYESVQKILCKKYSEKTKNGKKLENPYDYITLRDSDIMLLIVTYFIKINRPEDQIRTDPKTKLPEQLEGTEEVIIILPRYVNGYYFRIQGNYYAPMFQIVDNSTYNNGTSKNAKVQLVTLKTRFMPIKIYREFYELTPIGSNEPVKCCLYSSYMFSKKVDAMKYMLGRYGYYGALEFLELCDIYIRTIDDQMFDSTLYYNFKCRDKFTVISVSRFIFDNDQVTQSFVYTLQKAIFKYDQWDTIFDPRFWNRSLGGDFMSATIDKGIPVLDSFESIYDIKSRNAIRLPMEDKSDAYRITRWMMREFANLRLKDNLNISTKMARQADGYLDCFYAFRLSKNIYRISDKGKSVLYSDVVRAINLAPDTILKMVNNSKSSNTSNLVNYVNAVNDNDAELALEFTYKGISGLGDQGAGTAIPDIFRTVHPSHVGRVDLDSSTASDPGLSGSICPMADVCDDGIFSEGDEPNTWKSSYQEMVNNYRDMIGVTELITLQQNLGLSYDHVKDDMVRETLETYKRLIPLVEDMDGVIDYSINESLDYIVKGTGADGLGDIVFSEEDMALIPPNPCEVTDSDIENFYPENYAPLDSED